MKDEELEALITEQSAQALIAAKTELTQQQQAQEDAKDTYIRGIFANIYDIDQQLKSLSSIDPKKLSTDDQKQNKVEIDFLTYKRNKILSGI